MNLPLYAGKKVIRTKHALTALIISVPVAWIAVFSIGFTLTGVLVALFVILFVSTLLMHILARLW